LNENDDISKVDLALVLGYIATKDLASTEKRVAVLMHLGFANKDMAKICGTTEGVVKTLKSKIKKGV
jgi:DNA-binding NarL/FixJ family response regulator